MKVNIIHPPDFLAAMDSFGVSKQVVKSTFENPVRTQQIGPVGDIKSQLLLKYFGNSGSQYAIVIHGQWINESDFQFRSVYKLYPDISDSFDKSNPTELLYSLADKFGFLISIGGISQKCFFMQEIPINSIGAKKVVTNDEYVESLLTIHTIPPNNRDVTINEGIYSLQFNEITSTYLLKVVLIFYLNKIEYLNYINSKYVA